MSKLRRVNSNGLKLEILNYKNNILHFDGINLLDVVSNSTPFYLYSQNKILSNLDEYQENLSDIDSLVCYSVKANSSISILSLLAKRGCGFDIVSGGELAKVIKAGGNPSTVVFSGVGKLDEEIRLAIQKQIFCFNIESHSELIRINNIASELKLKARIAIRVNPAIDAKTHPYIATGMNENKFGISEKDVINIYSEASKLDSIEIKGIDFHIGSQITELSPFMNSFEKIKEIINKLSELKIKLQHIDIGGGLGIRYENENLPSKKEFIDAIKKELSQLGLKIVIEPGRSLVGDAGIIVTKVLYVKKTSTKNFLIVDVGMNDFLRPPLYGAFHSIKEVEQKKIDSETYDVVGPVCESTDFMGKDRQLSAEEGDYLVIENAGAYGFALSSNYNSRPKPAELMTINGKAKVIRNKETSDQLIINENLDV